MKDINFEDIDKDSEDSDMLEESPVSDNHDASEKNAGKRLDDDVELDTPKRGKTIGEMENDIAHGRDPRADRQDRSDNGISEHDSRKRKKKHTLKSELLSYLAIVVGAFIIALLVNKFVIINATVPTGSMLNTINEQDRLIGFRLAYLFSNPQRGDVVIFYNPDDTTQKSLLVKRVIGLPGDTVEIRDGHVYINGEMLVESYIREDMIPGYGDGIYQVPEGCYFMMGDNRNNSKDSRFLSNGYIEKNKIIAKVSFRYYDGTKGSISFSAIK